MLNAATRHGSDRSGLVRFQTQPLDVVLGAAASILDAHLAVAAAGFVAVDLYDGTLLWDEATETMRLIDLDEYRPGPFAVSGERLPGSLRYMAPEELRQGGLTDERTTVFGLGRALHHLLAGPDRWRGSVHQRDVIAGATRTDPDLPKHAGITYFIVDMATPGIEVRPLRQITGHAHFNEVFLTDVAIPSTDVVGEVNGGWGVAQTTLASERSMISGGGAGTGVEQLVDLARDFGRTDDAGVRQDLAHAYTRIRLLEFLGLRAQTALSQGRMPGPEVSVMKLAISDHMERTGDLLMALEGAYGTLGGEDAPREQLAQYQFLGQWSVRIGGGTDQVQRNVIGERVLGLPREARADKDVPFRELQGA